MKLLLDENLSSKSLCSLQLSYPESKHVSELGLSSASDSVIWNYAKTHGFAMVSRDADFADMSALYGKPPFLIWLRIFKLSKALTTAVLLKHALAINQAALEQDTACIEIHD